MLGTPIKKKIFLEFIDIFTVGTHLATAPLTTHLQTLTLFRVTRKLSIGGTLSVQRKRGVLLCTVCHSCCPSKVQWNGFFVWICLVCGRIFWSREGRRKRSFANIGGNRNKLFQDYIWSRILRLDPVAKDVLDFTIAWSFYTSWFI